MTPLVIESWIWWAIVLLVALSRFISRRMVLRSFLKFQADDFCMAVLLCFYTVLIVTINIVRTSSSNLLPPGFDLSTLDNAQIIQREYGSKLVLVVEQSQCVVIWGAKASLLILYLRLTTLRWENIAIKILAGYVALSFLIMEVLYFGVWCRPFNQYWAVPTSSTQCNAATNHLITNASFNLSSDLLMLAIGLPMFLRLNLPWQKKYPIVGIFSLGIFVILAAILNKVYSFSEPFGDLWSYWYVRESSTALLVANLPFVWNFWRRITGFSSVIGGSRRGASMVDTTAISMQEEKSRKGSGLARFWPSRQRDEVEECDGVDFTTGPKPSQPPQSDGLKDHDSQQERQRNPTNYSGSSGDLHPLTRPAVIVDVPPQGTVRRHDSLETRHTATPISSTLPSLNGSWQADSFV
ncbi:unnamed protein product [Zymoseptoria tritici ST99CH_1A5]|uniref:Rhodopsin domain-containing protein n=2 Tax=Zymoseptoria tritici TaxID=1047171 RepID=A0A2H1FKT2_ZYMTR|nr:unnamed protein product [Zymoseptoria tritici ST99CH_1E4]SMY19278.1 unnamed protein product [Zymoseptoria tritici ST99CH_1A5]